MRFAAGTEIHITGFCMYDRSSGRRYSAFWLKTGGNVIQHSFGVELSISSSWFCYF